MSSNVNLSKIIDALEVNKIPYRMKDDITLVIKLKYTYYIRQGKKFISIINTRTWKTKRILTEEELDKVIEKIVSFYSNKKEEKIIKEEKTENISIEKVEKTENKEDTWNFI